jgi:O-antigen ligase
VRRVSGGAFVLAASLPLLFLHVQYQPSVSLPFGVTFKLQDAAVLATVVAAAVAARRGGVALLRPALPLWLATAAFLLWILAATFYPLLGSEPYAWKTHFVTAVGFCEYALLAPAVPLLVRRRADAVLVLGTLVAWNVVSTVVGLLQWAGWNIADAWAQGRRQPSFLGPHDLAALGGMTLAAGLLALLWRERERLLVRVAWIGIVAGGLAFVLGGATAGIVGLVPGAAVAAAVAARRGLLGRRTIAILLATLAVASLGVVSLRSRDFDQFFRFLGAKEAQPTTHRDVQTYSQRTLLAYIGLRIWLDHPIVGAGWQASTEDAVVARELPAAHRHFPRVAERAFPGPGHQYGVQILYIQVLSDLGLVGLVLLLALVAAALLLGRRTAVRGPPDAAFAATLGLFWFVLALGLWTALGLVAGIPLDAMTWLAVGAIAAGAARASGRIAA